MILVDAGQVFVAKYMQKAGSFPAFLFSGGKREMRDEISKDSKADVHELFSFAAASRWVCELRYGVVLE